MILEVLVPRLEHLLADNKPTVEDPVMALLDDNLAYTTKSGSRSEGTTECHNLMPPIALGTKKAPLDASLIFTICTFYDKTLKMDKSPRSCNLVPNNFYVW